LFALTALLLEVNRSRYGEGNNKKETGIMGIKYSALFIFVTIIIVLFACEQKIIQVTELRHFPVDSMKGILTKSGVHFDNEVSSDGSGSLRITATEYTVVKLFEISDLDIDNARLVYQAKVRTEDMEGHVFLEMWCGFPGKGEFFSRDLQTPVTGTTNWTTEETPFFLQKGENPGYVKLNLVVNGKGTAWIDDIRLLKRPL
jgi:hypothetical protein